MYTSACVCIQRRLSELFLLVVQPLADKTCFWKAKGGAATVTAMNVGWNSVWGDLITPSSNGVPVYFPFYCRARHELPGSATFFLAECYRQILMSTESTNDLCVSGNRRTPLFRSSEERREGGRERRAVKFNSIALFLWFLFRLFPE